MQKVTLTKPVVVTKLVKLSTVDPKVNSLNPETTGTAWKCTEPVLSTTVQIQPTLALDKKVDLTKPAAVAQFVELSSHLWYQMKKVILTKPTAVAQLVELSTTDTKVNSLNPGVADAICKK